MPVSLLPLQFNAPGAGTVIRLRAGDNPQARGYLPRRESQAPVRTAMRERAQVMDHPQNTFQRSDAERLMARRTWFWGKVTVFMALLVVGWTGVSVARHQVLPSLFGQLGTTLASAALTCIVGLTIVATCRMILDQRSVPRVSTYINHRHARDGVFGAIFWMACAIPSLAVAAHQGWIRFDPGTLSVGAIGIALTHALTVLLLEAIPEEVAMRGYLLDRLADRYSLPAAVAGQAVLFAAWGLVLASLTGILGYASNWAPSIDRVVLLLVFGVALALVRLLRASLWAAIGFHLSFQTTIQLLFAGKLPGLSLAPDDLANASVVVGFLPIVAACIVAGIALKRGRVRASL